MGSLFLRRQKNKFASNNIGAWLLLVPLGIAADLILLASPSMHAGCRRWMGSQADQIRTKDVKSLLQSLLPSTDAVALSAALSGCGTAPKGDLLISSKLHPLVPCIPRVGRLVLVAWQSCNQQQQALLLANRRPLQRTRYHHHRVVA